MSSFVNSRWLIACWHLTLPRLLHSQSLVALGLSMRYETWPPNGWHHPFVSKYWWGLMHCGLKWPVGICTFCQKPLTVPLHSPNGRWIGPCKETVNVKESNPYPRRCQLDTEGCMNQSEGLNEGLRTHTYRWNVVMRNGEQQSRIMSLDIHPTSKFQIDVETMSIRRSLLSGIPSLSLIG